MGRPVLIGIIVCLFCQIGFSQAELPPDSYTGYIYPHYVWAYRPIDVYHISEGDLANAEADVAWAKGQQEEAISNLATIQTNLKLAFEATPEYIDAKQALADAQADHDAKQKVILDGLVDNADYKAAVQARDDAAKAVQDARDSGVTGAPFVELLNQRMAQSKPVTDLQNASLAKDADFAAAKKKLDAARAAMKAIQTKGDNATRANKEYSRSQVELNKAKAAVTTTGGAAQAAEQARNRQEQDRINRENQARMDAQRRNGR